MKKFFGWLSFLLKSAVFKSILKMLLEGKQVVLIDRFVLKIVSITDDEIILSVKDKEAHVAQTLKKQIADGTI